MKEYKTTNNMNPETFKIHYRDEIKIIKDFTGQDFADFPEGKQTMSFTMCAVLMRIKAHHVTKEHKSLPWWKRLFTFALFLCLLSCTCLPQIPTQVLYLDTACTVTVPDYMTIFQVYDNCTDVLVVQYPGPGTILDHPDPFSVDLVARDRYGNSTGVTFNVEIIDTIPPAIHYIGDTVMVYHRHELDQLIDSYITYRQHLGDTAIKRDFKVWF